MKMRSESHAIFKDPEIGTLLDVNIGHINQNDDKLLKKACKKNTPIVVYKYEEGYFVHVSDDDDPELFLLIAKAGFSEEFITIYRRAKELGCYFLRLDCDGTGYNDLPVFDWS